MLGDRTFYWALDSTDSISDSCVGLLLNNFLAAQIMILTCLFD